MNGKILSLLILIIFISTACVDEGYNENNKLFKQLSSATTNIDFVNQLDYNKDFNIYTYRNFYNGGGVALGDINNDGLLDIYFTSNMGDNKLYLNKGKFNFEDITEKAGVAGKMGWSAGVSMADVNADGFLDIYVCNSGEIKNDKKSNELFINNGDLTFSERAYEYGIDDEDYSTHGAFFDYDKDGDLDLYLLNNSYKAIGSFNLEKNERGETHEKGGDKLYKNENGKFVDVSKEAGIYRSVIGFGLGVTIGDINNDNWLDLYISNDFFERDYIYINKGNGTFDEVLTNQMKSISAASMGADMADINNDIYPEIFVTEMLPEDNSRVKTVTTFEDWDQYQFNLQNDYYHQFTRNMLHLNNCNGTFSEIGRLAGVEATDWSWGALICDFNNDGFKDIFVANGIYQDLTNLDYLEFISKRDVMRSIVIGKDVDYKTLIDAMPSNRIPNYMFMNNQVGSWNEKSGYEMFRNVSQDWGLDTPSHSNGSAYGDLDNDGDMDLVVNNVNMEAFVYENRLETTNPKQNFLKIILNGSGKNTQAIGAKIIVKNKNSFQYLEQVPNRGFQSSVDPRPNFGFPNRSVIDTLIVIWPNDKKTIMSNVETNRILELNQEEATNLETVNYKEMNLGEKVFLKAEENYGIDYKHVENKFSDFNRNKLIFHMLSTEGPASASGDLNNDGLEDFYVGGAKDSPGKLYLQTSNKNFVESNIGLFESDKTSEDTDAAFFDADNDGDLDLYVTSGGSELPESSSALIDRLYFNKGNGYFEKSSQPLPTSKFESTSCVKPIDFDLDGDIDLFVGVRLKPFLYGIDVNGYLLENDGDGNFSNVNEQKAPVLNNIGMITDATWADIDSDGDPDLIVVGEYMTIRILENRDGKLNDITEETGLSKTNGWWNVIESGDLDADGDVDFVIGNHGLNSRFKASEEKPVKMYINDFDKNGRVEQIITVFNNEKAYPLALKHDLVSQIPTLKSKYEQYESYKDQTFNDLFSSDQIQNTVTKEVFNLETSILINNGNKTFELKSLPLKAQFSPVYGILVHDFNNDNIQDIILGGNLYNVKPEVGRYDASYGLFLKGLGNNEFESVNSKNSGFFVNGQIRGFLRLMVGGEDMLFVVRNNTSMKIFSLKGNKIIPQ